MTYAAAVAGVDFINHFAPNANLLRQSRTFTPQKSLSKFGRRAQKFKVGRGAVSEVDPWSPNIMIRYNSVRRANQDLVGIHNEEELVGIHNEEELVEIIGMSFLWTILIVNRPFFALKWLNFPSKRRYLDSWLSSNLFCTKKSDYFWPF